MYVKMYTMYSVAINVLIRTWPSRYSHSIASYMTNALFYERRNLLRTTGNIDMDASADQKRKYNLWWCMMDNYWFSNPALMCMGKSTSRWKSPPQPKMHNRPVDQKYHVFISGDDTSWAPKALGDPHADSRPRDCLAPITHSRIESRISYESWVGESRGES